MRAIFILAAIALTHGAKLERAYLPPSNARTAGGSGNFLQTPISGISGSSRNYQNTLPQSNDYVGNSFAQSGNDIAYSGNDIAYSGNDFARSGNGQNGAEYNNVNYNFANEGRPERPRAAFERNAAILRQDNSNDGETYSYAYETENGIYAEESAVATNGVEAQGGYSYTGDDGQVYSVRYTADQNGFVPLGDHLPTPPPIPEEILKALEQNARDEAAGIYDDGSYNEAKYAGDSNNYNYQQNNAYNRNNDDTIVTNSLIRSGNAPSYTAPTYIAPNPNAVASTFGARNVQNARNFAAIGASNAVAPIYGARNQIALNFNAANPIAPTYGTPNTISPSYGVPNAQNARSFNAASPIAPTFGAPNIPFNRNTPSFTTATANNAPVYNAPNAGISRNSAEKAYLPPFSDQRGQARNVFGRRQQSFNARTGYNY